ncbi:MAG: dipeptide ABC transporter ATP-binding protein [Calditrichia bacterium]
MESQVLIRIRGLQRKFPVKETLFGKPRAFVHAVNSVDMDLFRGKTVGLVGESGCGKTTIGRILAGLDVPDDGSILYNEKSITSLSRQEKKAYHRKVQIIFQNPYAALNPRQRIVQMFREVFRVHRGKKGKKSDEEILRLLETVGISRDALYRYPFEFSGGQRQRLCIARSLAVQPEVLICDEPVSALDVSIQSQILTLLKQLQEQFGLTYLFISHDLSVIYHICDFVYIMYLGQIMEQGGVEEIFRDYKHPYTQALMSAIPIPDPKTKRKRIILKGEVPNPIDIPTGCPFHTRCPAKIPICSEKLPPQVTFSPTHEARCWLYHHEK